MCVHLKSTNAQLKRVFRENLSKEKGEKKLTENS